jgi:hypothetical protein
MKYCLQVSSHKYGADAERWDYKDVIFHSTIRDLLQALFARRPATITEIFRGFSQSAKQMPDSISYRTITAFFFHIFSTCLSLIFQPFGAWGSIRVSKENVNSGCCRPENKFPVTSFSTVSKAFDTCLLFKQMTPNHRAREMLSDRISYTTVRGGESCH